MNSYSTLSDPNEPVDPTDVEFFKFTGLVADAKVSIQNEAFDIAKYPATVSIIACASKTGNFAVATVNGFIFSSTKALRTAFHSAEKGTTVPFEQDRISIPLSKPIRQLRFTATEQEVVLAVEGGGLLVYKVDDIKKDKENTKPTYDFTLSQEVVDLRPNPEEFPHLAAVLSSDNRCRIIDITNGSTTCELPVDDAAAICWSPKGKQIVCGKMDGSLQHFDTNGVEKANLPIPTAMSAGNGEEKENRSVQDVLWIENHIFLVLYARKPENSEDPYLNDGYIINRKPRSGTEPTYTRLAEITPIFTTEGRGNHFYMEVIRGLGKEIKHLVVIANAATNETSVVGEDEQGVWSTWQLPENGIASLPLSEANYVDTYPLGLCLDFSADEKLAPEGDSEQGAEPVPILYYVNDEGHMGAYHCYNIELARRGESYKATEVKHVTMTIPGEQPPAANPPPSGFSAFGAAATSDNAFADLLSGKTTSPPPPQGSAFGSAFGSAGANIPSFSNLGSAAKISPGFGFNNTAASSTPAFGSSSGFGSGSTTEPPKTETPPTTGSFASFAKNTVAGAIAPKATFGQTSGFGSSPTTTTTQASTTETKPTTQPPAPAFGSTTPLAGGSFASFAKNTVPGATAPKSAFGQTSGFGSSPTTTSTTTPENTETKPATPPPAPAFGSTTPLTGGSFASFAKNTVPGATAPKTAFGQTSGFGSSPTTTTTTQPTTTETKPTTTPAFGSTTPLAGGSFASFAKNTVPGATTPNTTFGSPSGFGKSTTTPATTPASAPVPPKATTPTTTPATAPVTPPVTTPAAAPVTPPVTKPAASTETAKPVADDGMAKQFEGVYFKVTEDLDKLKEYYNKVSLMMKVHTMGPESKTEESLKNPELRWSLNEASQLGVIADGLVAKNKKDEENVDKVKENVDALIENCKKLMDKQEDIKYLLGKEVDSNVVDILDNRELDPETKTSLNALQTKVDATDNTIQDLELKVQVNNNRNKIKNDHNAGTLSLYSLHRSIRDIEREITAKNKDITELEERLDKVKLNDGKGKDKASNSGISCDDVSDSEDEETISREVIERTTRYIRRYNFLDTVVNETSRRLPLAASTSK